MLVARGGVIVISARCKKCSHRVCGIDCLESRLRAHDVNIPPPLVLQVEADAGGRLWSLVLVSIVANLNTVYLRATLSKVPAWVYKRNSDYSNGTRLMNARRC